MYNKFIRVDEVAQELSVSKPYAYKLIKKLNDELKEQGFMSAKSYKNKVAESLVRKLKSLVKTA